MKLDIQNFFRSIDKDILWDIFIKKIENIKQSLEWKAEILWLSKLIIFHDPALNYLYKGNPSLKKLIISKKSLIQGDRNKGLPIGNLTSQFFANIYLNELGHFIINNLNISKSSISTRFYLRYIRYVDDFVIIDENKEKLAGLIKSIDNFLKVNLKLRLHPKKIYLQSVSHGIDFLGYFVKPTQTLVRRKVVARFKKKLKENIDLDTGFLDIKHIPMINSYLGHFRHANTFNLIRRLKR